MTAASSLRFWAEAFVAFDLHPDFDFPPVHELDFFPTPQRYLAGPQPQQTGFHLNFSPIARSPTGIPFGPSPRAVASNYNDWRTEKIEAEETYRETVSMEAYMARAAF